MAVGAYLAAAEAAGLEAVAEAEADAERRRAEFEAHEAAVEADRQRVIAEDAPAT